MMADNGAASADKPQTVTPVTSDSKVVTKDETQSAATKGSDVKCQPVRWHQN